MVPRAVGLKPFVAVMFPLPVAVVKEIPLTACVDTEAVATGIPLAVALKAVSVLFPLRALTSKV